MIEVNFNTDDLAELISQEVKKAVAEAMTERQLPYLMTLKETADFLGVSYPTVHRASKIKGFPVTYDFGHTKVVTDQLLEWIKNRSNYALVYEFGS